MTPFTDFSETNPNAGAVEMDDVCISEAERWFEDGVHVVRSTEFDCIAEHEDAGEVLDVFFVNVLELSLMLVDLDQAGEATDDERATLALIGSRLAQWSLRQEERERERRRRSVLSRLRKRGGESSHWRRRSTRSNSSLPSPA